MKRFILPLLLLSVPFVAYSEEYPDWLITLQGSNQTYNTQTQEGSRKGVTRKGLISVSKSGSNQLEVYWEPGAYRATSVFNQTKIIDGFDLDDVSRTKSFRFNKEGDTAYIRTTKGPQAIVELIYNQKSIVAWPRLSIVSLLSFQKTGFYISLFSKKTQATEFWFYSLPSDDHLQAKGEKVGTLKNCSLLSSKVVKTGIAMSVYCDRERGSDVVFLSFKTGKIEKIKATSDDEFLAYSHLKKSKDSIPVMSLSGSNQGRIFFHAISQSFTKYLGEPIAYSSDESGKQSWSQSYRTLSLANLYKKTGHPVFATLAQQAMERTLDQQNLLRGIGGDHNPSCAWASRIYSEDGKSPLSFMINQGMISSGLIYACELLGDNCPLKLRQAILNNASCLAVSYEKYYLPDEGLYRIPYAAPFRYDGIWAPWNWHMMWSSVLSYVGHETDNRALTKRAHSITNRFIKTWEETREPTSKILWRYWPEQYYRGWQSEDLVSASRPKQKKKNLQKERYEDINHASISLLGLSHMKQQLSSEQINGLENTLKFLLQQGTILPRDMDGQGPRSPRWLPGAGWHIIANPALEQLYSRYLPGASTGDQHLAYAQLFDPEKEFSIELSFSQCRQSACEKINSHSFDNPKEFLTENPIFSLREIQ
ncbi:hypothetical protein [Kiloniella sp. EL199]|uniref:hypothetical protein n=1 Tax=Kiloniella sp. EL199 TaxID=2107581 RepID=UPI000EA0669D|nr:hypothetical protein [Kiloniella sp. EL199]